MPSRQISDIIQNAARKSLGYSGHRMVIQLKILLYLILDLTPVEEELETFHGVSCFEVFKLPFSVPLDPADHVVTFPTLCKVQVVHFGGAGGDGFCRPCVWTNLFFSSFIHFSKDKILYSSFLQATLHCLYLCIRVLRISSRLMAKYF